MTAAVAIISCVIAALSFLGNYVGSQKAQAGHQAVYDAKLDNLTKQVEKHNNLVERMYSLEDEVHILSEKQKVANHRIDDLEKEQEK